METVEQKSRASSARKADCRVLPANTAQGWEGRRYAGKYRQELPASLAFCASHCQSRSLNLQAWQTPPMWVRDLDAALREPFGGKRGDREAAELLQRMLDAGLSKYEPDPLAALDQAMRSAP